MTTRQSRQTAGQSLPDSLRNCLSLDIEVSRQSGQIVVAAACNPQTVRTWRAKGPLTQLLLLELDRIAAEADHLVGHNILAFDLLRLKALHAELGLLDSPPLGHPGIRRPPAIEPEWLCSVDRNKWWTGKNNWRNRQK